MNEAWMPRLGQIIRWDGHPWKVDHLHETGLDLRNLMTGEVQLWSLASWIGGMQRGEFQPSGAPNPLDRHRPRCGSYIRRAGAVWSVSAVRGGLIHLVNVTTKETTALSLEAWEDECWHGEAEVVGSPDADIPEHIRELLTVPIDGLPESMKAVVKWGAVFVDAYRNSDGFYRQYMPDLLPENRIRLDGRLSKNLVDPFLRQVAGATGLRKPGFSTFCKMLVKVHLAKGDIRAIAPRYDRRGPHERRMPAKVEQWLIEAITSVWLTLEQNRKSEVWVRLEARVRRWNKEHPDRPLWCPSKGHVARYIREEVDRHVANRHRKGRKAAAQEDKPIGSGINTTFPLERVEVDHTRLNRINVIDDRTGDDLGGAWATVALDHFTRMPLAILVHFDGETLGAVFSCLRMVMTPKDFLKELVPGLDYRFPTGVPVSFYFDQTAASNNEHVLMAGRVLDIIMDYAPGENPQFKACIERFIRTLKEDVQQPLVGPKNVDHQEANSNGRTHVAVKYSVLVRRLWHWVTMVYAKSWHTGIDDVPLRRWQEATDNRLPRALRRESDLSILLTRKVSCVPARGRVTHSGLTWMGEAVRAITAHPGFRKGMTVEVSFDEYDVSKAWVTNPFTGGLGKLEPADRAYMTGLTLHQHDRILKRDGRRERAYNTAELRDRRASMMDEADELIGRASGLTPEARRAVSRFKGKGQNQPTGDDLGEVEPHPDVPDRKGDVQTPTSAEPPADTGTPRTRVTVRQKNRSQRRRDND